MYNMSPYSLSRSFRDKPCRAVIYGRASTEHEAQVKALQNQMQWYDDVARFHPQWNVINRYIDQGIRAVIYGRASTEHEAQVKALQNQMQWYDDVARFHPQWNVINRYIDQGITGTQVYKRDAFMRMMEDAKQQKFDLIVTREVCRFARNTVDALVCVRQLAAIGIEVYFVNDNIWTLDGDGELRLTIMATMAQEESRKISERSLAGQRVSREKGVLYGNGNIFGYTRNKLTKQFEIDPDQAETVKMIFDLYDSGMGETLVAKELTRLGRKNGVGKELTKQFEIDPDQAETVKMIFDLYDSGMGETLVAKELTRLGRKNGVGKVKWDAGKVSKIIKRKNYLGYTVYCQSYSNNYLEQKRIKRDESEFVYVKGGFPQIISEEQYERCNLGYTVYCQSYSNNYLEQKRIKRDESEFVYVKGGFPQIISEEQYERCNAIRRSRTKRLTDEKGRTRSFGIQQAQNVWGRKMRCRCGSPMLRHRWRRSRTKRLTDEKGRTRSFGIQQAQNVWGRKMRCRCGSPMLRHRWRTNNAGKPIYGYECKRHHDTPRIRLQNEQGNPTPICEIKPVGQSKLELMASQIFERVWGDQREIVLQTCKMLDACYKPDADRRADLMKAKDDSVQLLQQQLDDLVVVRARGEIEQDKFLQRTIEIQQQMEALRQSKAQIASEDYNPGRLDMEAIEAALCEAVEMHDGLVSEDFIDLFVSQVTPLSDSRFAWCLDFSPQPTVAFLNLAGQRKYTTCSMDSKLHFGPFADEEGHTIPFPGSLRR